MSVRVTKVGGYWMGICSFCRVMPAFHDVWRIAVDQTFEHVGTHSHYHRALLQEPPC